MPPYMSQSDGPDNLQLPNRKVRVLIIGQTPPPYGGQALMIEALLQGAMPRVELRHVRMAYSKDLSTAGNLTLPKLLHLPQVILRALKEIKRFSPDLLYYPPAGPNLVPVLRDLVTLVILRLRTRCVLFHFHAGGLSQLWPSFARYRVAASLFRRAFFYPAGAVMLSRYNPPDGQVLSALRSFYIPYGLPDYAQGFVRTAVKRDPTLRVLYVGVLLASKGVLDLVGACRALWTRGMSFELDLVGSHTPSMRSSVLRAAGAFHERIHLWGVLTDQAKWDRYRAAAVFCYPSYFEAESFGLVCLEAMMFGLPIVATTWRGVQDLVSDGHSGYLVPVRDGSELAERLRELLRDASLRERFGREGRRRYEEEFSINLYIHKMESALVETASSHEA
jgi:glycosyltransferase involved in cell wall biosynthesis